MHSEISKNWFESTGIDAQKIFVLRKVLEAGSGKIQDVLENLLRCAVDKRMGHLDIADSRELTRVLASGSYHHVVVTSDLGGDMRGKAVLVLRGRDFTAICEMLSKANPYRIHPDVGPDMLEKMIPEWVKKRTAEHSSSFEVREYMFDAVAEFANMVFAGYLVAAHKYLGLTTFHSPPITGVDLLHALKLGPHLWPNPRNRHYALFAESHFVALPYDFKIWFLLIPGEDTFSEILNRIEVVDQT